MAKKSFLKVSQRYSSRVECLQLLFADDSLMELCSIYPSTTSTCCIAKMHSQLIFFDFYVDVETAILRNVAFSSLSTDLELPKSSTDLHSYTYTCDIPQSLSWNHSIFAPDIPVLVKSTLYFSKTRYGHPLTKSSSKESTKYVAHVHQPYPHTQILKQILQRRPVLTL